MPGDKCLTHARSRLFAMATLRKLRDELKRGFLEYRGVEFGLTVRVSFKEVSPVWYDIMVLISAPPKSTFLLYSTILEPELVSNSTVI